MHPMPFQIKVHTLINVQTNLPWTKSAYHIKLITHNPENMLQNAQRIYGPNPSTVTRSPTIKPGWKCFFEKWGELTLNRKTNTRL